ncbi:DUF1223 domain-containing protein [Sneathiella chungangensis]|uniref:DUF1223 domain-containing protein n=1 Tax=Sneathiella chungangensis TaxID=1418234 RepID=A0A845MI80_9PROT|nr:DUF1223 domain-containing protein [Sneathiella chungangensis]MZR23743.1 DUF1223 domain-containing protein [Sneathiella chungangensis]
MNIRIAPMIAVSAFVALIAMGAVNSAVAASVHQPSTVVELYTSQGCSSCPPADELLGELVKNDDVLGLSFGVTYWDYIGWKDIFGSSDNDARQVEYRGRFNSRYVYTPQMVVAGTEHIVGSDRSGVEGLIAKHEGHAKSLLLDWTLNGDDLDIRLPAGTGKATVWVVDIDRQRDVNIRRGENTGRIITYHNVVRKIRPLGDWTGEAKSIQVNLADMRAEGRDGCAIIVQQDGYGPILAALEVLL